MDVDAAWCPASLDGPMFGLQQAGAAPMRGVDGTDQVGLLMADDLARPGADERPKTPCPHCGAIEVQMATHAGAFVYLRCASCTHKWPIDERRKDPFRSGARWW